SASASASASASGSGSGSGSGSTEPAGPASGILPTPASHRVFRVSRRPALDYELDPVRDRVLLRLLSSITPGLDVLRGYRRRWLRPDVFAGVAVAAYLVPQVMAYTAIVNVPPVTGLWTALAALIVYAILGGSRVLSPGPESTVALMAGAAIAPLVAGSPDRAIALTAALSLIVAGWCLIARIFRLGVVADLLSQPLLVGYLAGGAVLMIVGQLGKATRTSVNGISITDQIRSFSAAVGGTHLPTLMVCAGTLALLLFVRWVRPSWPAPLIAVAVATVVCTVAGLAEHGVRIVGAVPTGLPAPHLPAVSWSDVQSLLIAGLGVAVVAYGDNTLIGRGFPSPVDEDQDDNVIDPQQELVALAGVHAAVGLVGGFPVSSSGSRTALAIAAGARTQVYSLVSAACVVIVLFVAGPLISNLPQASLAAVVFYAASKLVAWRDVVRLARFRTNELLLAVAAMLGTVVLGILLGVGVAVALSLLEMAQRLARPHEGVLGRVPGLPGMHDVDDHPNAQTLPGLMVYRYDAPLFFANVSDLQRRALLAVHQENAAFPDRPVRWFILNVEANVEVDITAADGLRQLHNDLADRGARLGLARVKHDLLVPLARAGLTELIGSDMLFPTLPVAEAAYLDWVAANGLEVVVPDRAGNPDAAPPAASSAGG
ncbi:MAG TPA: SulP family inorganic anion transporter, partial [Candidatus Lustribacter sp.]|nr:SulP family inorganic anion transporter [Candidatus Lustribacter sp.]